MDDTTYATKADITFILQRMSEMHRENAEWKDELEDYMDQKTEETKRHFDIVAENLKHDLWGIHKDKISVLDDRSKNHEERLVVVERQLAI